MTTPYAPTDIIENATTADFEEKVRTFRVEIDTPEGRDRTIVYHNERVVRMNGARIAVKAEPPIVRAFSGVAMETITILDPVLQQPVTLSIAGLATAIQERYSVWYAQDKARREEEAAAAAAAALQAGEPA